jgi:putative oxidoreductase
MAEPTLLFPALGGFYQALGPWVEALLRAIAGFILIPHGLRIGFGFFPNTGLPVTGSFQGLAAALERDRYRPGVFWAAIVLATELIAAPMLILGLFTRPVCIPIFILLALSVVAHRRDGWFWNTLGIEYPLLWTACALYFLVHGAGAISLDRLIGWEF